MTTANGTVARPPCAPGTQGTAARKCRIALYSHDTMGIGHMRRNLRIAQALVASPLGPTVLLVAGAREAGAFPMPPGVDCLALPALRKDPYGTYLSRRLDIGLTGLLSLRAQTLGAALEAFAPDLLIVDKEPRGALGELAPALEALRARGRTRCVLGLRDVLDQPEVVGREWRRSNAVAALRAYYDAVWVYGDRAVYDPVREYRPLLDGPEVRFTGYLDARAWRFPAAGEPDSLAGLGTGRLALCTVGGGQDGAALALAFARAEFPADVTPVILTGPFLPAEAREDLRRCQARRPCLRVLGFVTDPDALTARADLIVAMGGYNTTCEILAFAKPALVVPRVRPRREQLIRAERLRALGLLDLLHPDEVTPAVLTAWLARPHAAPGPRPGPRIDLGGLARLPALAAELLTANPCPPPRSELDDPIDRLVPC